MNKTDLIKAVAYTLGDNHYKGGGYHSDSARAVRAVLQTITKALREKKKVSVKGFGTFHVVTQKPYSGEVNFFFGKNLVRVGHDIDRDVSWVVFRPSPSLKRILNENVETQPQV